MATAAFVAPISSERSDAELVAAVRRGSDAAFEELYSRYSRRIGSYVRGMVGDYGRAEDITQEIFIAALKRMRDTERPIAFKPWIHEIAKNACIDSFRRARRAEEISLDADGGLSSADRGRLTVVTTPDAALDCKQALHDLRGAFGGLSDSHHEILVLRELEGRSYRDIGERLGISRPVVESTLFRARRRLAEEYDELASGRRCVLVRKMVDCTPPYSWGIRDRRRISRHLAHCHRCRTHARSAGFDESILNMPSAAKIAALLPISLLRGRWSAFGSLGPHRGRPSLLALRSVHTLARSSNQLVGAGTGAGRGAATAAALVLAGVGGGLVTDTSLRHPRALYAGAPLASAHRTYPRAAGPVGRPELTASRSSLPTARLSLNPTAAAGAPASSPSRPAILAAHRSSPAAVRARSAPATPAPAAPTGPGPTSTSDPGDSPATAGTDGGDPIASGTGSAPGTTSPGAVPPSTPTPAPTPAPTTAPQAGPSPGGIVFPGTLPTTLGGVTGALPSPSAGTDAGPSQSDPLAGAIGGVVSGLSQVAAQP